MSLPSWYTEIAGLRPQGDSKDIADWYLQIHNQGNDIYTLRKLDSEEKQIYKILIDSLDSNDDAYTLLKDEIFTIFNNMQLTIHDKILKCSTYIIEFGPYVFNYFTFCKVYKDSLSEIPDNLKKYINDICQITQFLKIVPLTEFTLVDGTFDDRSDDDINTLVLLNDSRNVNSNVQKNSTTTCVQRELEKYLLKIIQNMFRRDWKESEDLKAILLHIINNLNKYPYKNYYKQEHTKPQQLQGYFFDSVGAAFATLDDEMKIEIAKKFFENLLGNYKDRDSEGAMIDLLDSIFIDGKRVFKTYTFRTDMPTKNKFTDEEMEEIDACFFSKGDGISKFIELDKLYSERDEFIKYLNKLPLQCKFSLPSLKYEDPQVASSIKVNALPPPQTEKPFTLKELSAIEKAEKELEAIQEDKAKQFAAYTKGTGAAKLPAEKAYKQAERAEFVKIAEIEHLKQRKPGSMAEVQRKAEEEYNRQSGEAGEEGGEEEGGEGEVGKVPPTAAVPPRAPATAPLPPSAPAFGSKGSANLEEEEEQENNAFDLAEKSKLPGVFSSLGGILKR